MLAVLLVAIVGVGAAAGLYYNGIKDSMAYQGDADELAGALTEADYQEPFYVLVIGSDHWENYGARSDAMLLCRVDLNNAQITMVSVPRDTPYQIDGRTVKLNQVFAEQGEVACVEAVSQLTGVPISHYVELEFDQLEQVVNNLGGVMVDVPYAIDYQVYTKDQPMVHLDAGPQVLDGNEAVALARMRTDYADVTDAGDAVRQANIRAMMLGVMKQVLSSPVSEIPGHIQTLAGMVKTDIPLSDLIDWATKMAQADNVTVYTCTGPYQGGLDDETGLWLTEEAPEQWARLMAVVDAGGDPSEVLGDATLTYDGKVQNADTTVIEDESPEGAGDSSGS
ncbi:MULTISPECIES: LCP family protein [unclassified Adlercreutzia]|uniref:LCP family protein n=1 Tax=unclassified Adlercreutzia TaxID=2636013 RepID=UPI0013EB48D3|nr:MULTISPECIES: LCP family protein [unclassified Adlercreutzia]